MIKRKVGKNRHVTGQVTLGIMLAIGALPATASAGVTFTWDPAGASVPLAGAGSAFTADTIYGTHWLWSHGPAGSPLVPHPGFIYTVNFIEQIQQFSLGGGTPFVPAGLNGTPGAPGSYGLYLEMSAQTEQVGGSQIYDYHSMTMSLMADPGNNDGTLSSTVAGVGFSNTGPTGTADDITLASGTLVSGTYTLNPAAGIRSVGHFKQSFDPAVSEAGFFVTPVSPYAILEEFVTTQNAAFSFVIDPLNPSLQYSMVNGGTAVIDLRVPEPASLLLLSSALGLLLIARTRAR